QPDVSAKDKEAIISKTRQFGYKVTEVLTQHHDYLVGIGKKEFDIRELGHMPGIVDIHRVTDDYKLVSGKWKVGYSEIDLGDGVVIGDGTLSVMAGPCSIENEKQVDQTLQHLKEAGVRIMRGGVFKPRSSPYSFRGMGIEGLK